MKFFNWVHKRLHHTLPKDHDDLADDNNNIKAEKSHGVAAGDQEPVQADTDKQALLKKTVLVDALDGWKDGILTIGTFGFDPLKPLMGNPYLVLHSEEDDVDTLDFSSDDDNDNNDNDSDDDSEEDEVNPLIFTSLGNSFKDDDGCVIVDEECLLSVTDDKKNLGRTTLADLFLADADQADIKKKMMMGKLGIAIDDDDDFDDIKYTKKMNLLKAKRGLSFAKKLLPKVKDEASPIKNIQRLMRRMMKRKIHPELLDAKSQKSDGQMAATALELTPIAAIKSASLLA